MPLFILLNLTSMQTMLILVFVFMLFNLTNMLAMLTLVSKFVMIYVLVLICKYFLNMKLEWRLNVDDI
jgi:hypothetical protein